MGKFYDDIVNAENVYNKNMKLYKLDKKSVSKDEIAKSKEKLDATFKAAKDDLAQVGRRIYERISKIAKIKYEASNNNGEPPVMPITFTTTSGIQAKYFPVDSSVVFGNIDATPGEGIGLHLNSEGYGLVFDDKELIFFEKNGADGIKDTQNYINVKSCLMTASAHVTDTLESLNKRQQAVAEANAAKKTSIISSVVNKLFKNSNKRNQPAQPHFNSHQSIKKNPQFKKFR
ncbi:MAG: hypothetical protein LBM38_01450 [Clostridiales bacterium]|jgi:ElaB/YqjD/DUF883 family membrane-anchored ribosome-binding protein|nr:hypothetical protein [Clostridiales bacterium]